MADVTYRQVGWWMPDEDDCDGYELAAHGMSNTTHVDHDKCVPVYVKQQPTGDNTMTIEEANVAQVQANIAKTEAETELTKAHARLMNAQADELERQASAKQATV